VISTTRSGAVTTVTLDRPDRRNALTVDALDALEAAVADATTPVVYLTGAGPAFCAGADLDTVAALSRAEAEAFAERGQAVARTLAGSEAVVVAGVDGAARGGGVELALACDLRVATPAATFGEPGVTFGLFGAWGGTVRLPAVVGPSDAMDLALTGRVVDAGEARRMGLVSRVTDDPRSVAEAVAAADPDAVAAVRSLLRAEGTAAERDAAEAEAFAALVDAADFSDRL